MLQPNKLLALRTRRAFIDRGLETLASAGLSGVGPHQLIEGCRAIAALLNELGVDKSKLSGLIQFLRCAQRLATIEGADAKALADRVDAAVELATAAVHLTDTTQDDALVDTIARYLRDQEFRDFVLDLAVDTVIAGHIWPPSPEAVEAISAEAAKRQLDAAGVFSLMPYVTRGLLAAEQLREASRPTHAPPPMAISGATSESESRELEDLARQTPPEAAHAATHVEDADGQAAEGEAEAPAEEEIKAEVPRSPIEVADASKRALDDAKEFLRKPKKK